MDNAFRQGDIQNDLAQVNALSSAAWAPPRVELALKEPSKTRVDENESTASKLLREGEVFGTGLVKGIADGAREAADDKTGTALRLGASVATGALMTAMHGRTGMVGLAGRALSVGFGVSFIADVVAPDRVGAVGEVWSDTWKSADNSARNIDLTRQHLGRFAFDNIVMTAGGLAGAKGAGHLTEMYPGALTRFGSSLGETLRGGFGNQFGLTPALAVADGRTGGFASSARVPELGGVSENVMLSASHGRNDGAADSKSLLQLFKDSVARAEQTAPLFNPAPGLPGFSAGTRNILTGGTRPMADRVYGKEYSSSGLPSQGDYHPEGMKAIVPYENVARILDPASFQPKSIGSLAEMGEMLRAKQRVELGSSDPLALSLRQELATSGAKVKALDEEGIRLKKALDDQINVHGDYHANEIRWNARNVVEKENIVAGFEARAKEINALRLESARITMKLNKLDQPGAKGDTASGASALSDSAETAALRKHLEAQKAYLQQEITERSAKVGSVRDPESPISRAKEDLRRARIEARDWFVFGDRTFVEPERAFQSDIWKLRDQHYDNLTENLIAAQRAVETNAEAHKAMAVQFSESAYAYDARLHALQKPVINFTVNDATSLINGPLRATLRDHALSNLSTQNLQRPGALDHAVDKLYNQSSVIFFVGGKPFAEPVTGWQNPRMAFFDVRNFSESLPKLGDVTPEGFAVVSPLMQADGTLAVLETANNRGNRPVFKKEVSAVGGSVPHGVAEGTSLGGVIRLFNRG
ncbi:MAG: hypothetical protein JSS86_08445 [Cyanobacteria bacterium SZAS LIN-2]|nr:hypothetical protein [Cyanobacteria bacterium SZAS LIN-2]